MIHRLTRIGLWFRSLVASVSLFSLLFTVHFSGPGAFRAASILLAFRVTMIFALPAACLYLPFVIALKNAEERRTRTILVSGILIGPVSLVLWGLILLLRGGDPYKIWNGDPLAFGMAGAMIFALMVGFPTTFFYVIALKVLHHRSTSRPLPSGRGSVTRIRRFKH